MWAQSDAKFLAAASRPGAASAWYGPLPLQSSGGSSRVAGRRPSAGLADHRVARGVNASAAYTGPSRPLEVSWAS